jgi:hypothetical protein
VGTGDPGEATAGAVLMGSVPVGRSKWGSTGHKVSRWHVEKRSRHGNDSNRRWIVAGVVVVLALTGALTAVFIPRNPDPVAAFETIRPGMTYEEVRAVLVQRHVAVPLARSFGTPVDDAYAVLRGDPSSEKLEWGRVDGPTAYEAEWAREWRANNRVPLSTAPRQQYVVRQWGVANTQSYSFVAIFDEHDVVVCRYWTVPTESRMQGWLRRRFGT